MVAKYPCRACARNVNDNHHALLCDCCETWINRKCNNLTELDYDRLSKNNDTFICILCVKDNLPFSSLSDENFDLVVKQGVNYHYDQNDTDFAPLNELQINKINKFKEAFPRNPLSEDVITSV